MAFIPAFLVIEDNIISCLHFTGNAYTNPGTEFQPVSIIVPDELNPVLKPYRGEDGRTLNFLELDNPTPFGKRHLSEMSLMCAGRTAEATFRREVDYPMEALPVLSFHFEIVNRKD